jgi:hypothetical protein
MLDFLDLIDLTPVPGEVSHGREVKSEEGKQWHPKFQREVDQLWVKIQIQQ